MQNQPDGQHELSPQQSWRPLAYFNYYRLSLTTLILLLTLVHLRPAPLGEHQAQLFNYGTLVYFIFSIVAAIAIRQQLLPFKLQLFGQFLFDIVILTLLMHASGGVASGLGILLIITVAGASLISVDRTANFFAAVAAVAVLLELSYANLEGIPGTPGYTQAGILGLAFFATALIGHSLAKRLRETEALAARRGIDLANMAQLTEYIIQRMQTGVIVLDNNRQIRLMNEAASQLLQVEQSRPGARLDQVSPQLTTQLLAWLDNRDHRPPIFTPVDSAVEILPRFAHLGQESGSGTLIFIEDTAALAQQAQQLKLASLGRLTASIAHEIRNPLGAISHAAQLLAEVDTLAEKDRRLPEIIQQHSRRVNTIIENIMQLSRRQKTHSEALPLCSWLQRFLEDYSHDAGISTDIFNMQVNPANLLIRFDPSQLHQVLTNLVQNGLRHSKKPARLTLLAGIQAASQRPYLDVMDNGAGVAEVHRAELFEPFFTTENNGTGLGLYLARELCESNQARLDYIHTEDAGACFRITFSDPRREQVI